MSNGTDLVRVFTGTEILVSLLKEDLENAGVAVFVRNDFQSGITVGFVGGVISAVDLYVQESDLDKANPIINEFRNINNE